MKPECELDLVEALDRVREFVESREAFVQVPQRMVVAVSLGIALDELQVQLARPAESRRGLSM